MAKRKKTKPHIKSHFPPSSERFPTPRLPDDTENVRFSFAHLDFSNTKFQISRCDYTYFNSLLNRLKDISNMRMKDFRGKHLKSLKNHVIIWSETSEPEGFSSLNEQLQDAPAFQFAVTANKHGRVHGIILEAIFYVVWLDPEHKLNP